MAKVAGNMGNKTPLGAEAAGNMGNTEVQVMAEAEYITKAYAELEHALAAWEATWGPTDGLHALPQAIQLEARIALGEDFVQTHPGDARARQHLAQLRHRLAQAQQDPADRRRCQRYREAEERFKYHEKQYLALLRGEPKVEVAA